MDDVKMRERCDDALMRPRPLRIAGSLNADVARDGGALTLSRIVLAMAFLATGTVVTGCGQADILPETMGVARAELVPTFTPLPASTATMTALPTATAVAPYSTPTPNAFVGAGLPVRLEIPAIEVDAAIEKVGLDSEGKVDVPKIAANVAWFTHSALPGEDGKTSVISGHLDDPYGRAVFWNLRHLIAGDELVVTYSSGERFLFVVEDKERYATDAVPSQRIFGATAKRMLNLITCDGAWDGNDANYDQRLVVYTSLKDTSTSD